MAKYSKQGDVKADNGSYEKAKASVSKATSHFPDVPTIGAKEVVRLREEGKKVVLVDVRTDEEIAVSVLRGAVTREEFEKSELGQAVKSGREFKEFSSGASVDQEVVVPYCTVGYRSGQYAKKLQDLGYPSVRNSEGVVLWTHDIGSGFVTTESVSSESGAKGTGGANANDPFADDSASREVKKVHVYGSPWDHAREDFETVKFAPTGWLRSTIKSLFKKQFRR